MTNATRQLKTTINDELGKILTGIDELATIISINIVNNGHFLIGGPTGSGKTLLANCITHLLGNNTGRLDCRNDTDIVGIVQALSGTVASDPEASVDRHAILYLDGLNRLTPNTQSILLLAMEENQLSNHGISMDLHESFRVIASYDPDCYDGTYPLINALLDRFEASVNMTYQNKESETAILKNCDLARARVNNNIESVIRPLGTDQLDTAAKEVSEVSVSETVYQYIAELMARFRSHAELMPGISHRAGQSLLNAARVHALLSERDYVNPDDIVSVAQHCLVHRLRLTSDALLDGVQLEDIIQAILEQCPTTSYEAN